MTGNRGFYSNAFLSARGSDPESGQGCTGGLDIDAMWDALATSGTQKIDASHIPALGLLSGTVSNAQLANSSITVAGVEVPLGSAVTTAQIATALTAAGYKLTDTTYGLATDTTAGLVKTGYLTQVGTKNYGVKLNSLGQMYVSVPWTDTVTTLASLGITATAAEINKLDGLATTATELGYVHGVTSNIQTQLNAKANASALAAYALKDGSNASGTWPISISGTAEYSNILSNNSSTVVSNYVKYHKIGAQPSLIGSTATNGAWCLPTTGGDAAAKYGNGQILRLGWSQEFYTDIHTGPNVIGNSSGLQFRQVVANNSYDWRILLDTANYTTFLDTRYLLKSSYTAADILAKLKTVDGSGSGLDADLLDGLSSGIFFRGECQWIANNTDCRKLYGLGAYLNATGNGSGNSNFPDTYGVLLNFPYIPGSSNFRVQFHANAAHPPVLTYRVSFDSSQAGWQTVARTTDNVASATKLATARTLWGQSFDGSGNVTGTMYNISHIYMSGNVFLNANAVGPYLVGNSTGLTVCMHTAANAWSSTMMHVDANGNVGIGTPTPSYKLHVAGEIYATSNVRAGGAFITDWNNSYTFSNSNILNYNYGKFQSGIFTVSANNTCQPVLAWCNQVASYGYRTRYSIASVRTSAWGSMRLSVGNTDAGDSVGAYIDINGSGEITLSGTVHATVGIWSSGWLSFSDLSSTSDRRFKDGISPLARKSAVEVIMALKPSTWTWNALSKVRGRSAGFVAQDVAGVLPDAIREIGEDKHLALNYQMLHAYEVAALQEHDDEITQLRTRVAELERQLKEARSWQH